MIWDFIVVGGGLAGSVVSNRLLQAQPEANILLVEAGKDASNDQKILYPNGGGDLSQYLWGMQTVPQPYLNGRSVGMVQPTALGGGTVVNGANWVRGDRQDYDDWGLLVGDERWSYDGLLQYMKNTETFAEQDRNPDQHGFDGPVHAQTVTSTGRNYPLRDPALQSWEELGFTQAPALDGNAGNPIGVAEVSENRDNGKRQIASSVYPLDGITVVTQTLVQNVIITKDGDNNKATGILLANGTTIEANNVVLSAGAIRTPQLLMLSGVGPVDELQKHQIEVKVDSPQVGKNLMDHSIADSYWKIKNPGQGWVPGSGNPIFMLPQYNTGFPQDFTVCDTVGREELIQRIAMDEGAQPDPNHPLLRGSGRTFHEFNLMYSGSNDGSAVQLVSYLLQGSARGSVTLSTTNIQDFPLVDPKYYSTQVDRYVHRAGLKTLIRYAGTGETQISRDILAGENVPEGLQPLSLDMTEAEFDHRLASSVRPGLHFQGTASMGQVVDNNLKVNGVNGLYVVDASVIPVQIAAHIQVAVYALAEQAAEIIAGQAIQGDNSNAEDDEADDEKQNQKEDNKQNSRPKDGDKKNNSKPDDGKKGVNESDDDEEDESDDSQTGNQDNNQTDRSNGGNGWQWHENGGHRNNWHKDGAKPGNGKKCRGHKHGNKHGHFHAAKL